MQLISDKYSIDDIERFLDRVAEEIAVSDSAPGLLLIYEWLEAQLEARRRRQNTMDSVAARLAQRVRL